jgi:hypothetical protein
MVISQTQKVQRERSDLVANRIAASGGGVVAAQRAIQQWNATQPLSNRIEPKDIANAKKRRENEELGIAGTVLTKRNRGIAENAALIYNP